MNYQKKHNDDITTNNTTSMIFPPPNHPLDSAHPTDEAEDDDDDNDVPKMLNQDGFLVDNTEHKTVLVDDNGFIVPPTTEELTHIYERVERAHLPPHGLDPPPSTEEEKSACDEVLHSLGSFLAWCQSAFQCKSSGDSTASICTNN